MLTLDLCHTQDIFSQRIMGAQKCIKTVFFTNTESIGICSFIVNNKIPCKITDLITY